MIRFSEHKKEYDLLLRFNLSTSDFNVEELRIISESIKADTFYSSISRTLLQKIENLSGKLKAQPEIDVKLDIMSEIIKYQSALNLLSLAATTQDKTIYKGGRRG